MNERNAELQVIRDTVNLYIQGFKPETWIPCEKLFIRKQ